MGFGDLFDSPWKILIVAVVIIILFGSRKLPAAARSLGQSMRILKKEVSGLHDDEEPEGTSATLPAQPAAAQQLQSTPQAPEAHEQIANLQKQLNDLQKQTSVGANGASASETQQTR
jgi:sec-independent protein translocase protein TatA